MAQRKSVQLEQHQLDVIEDMHERELADNESEALRMLLNAGKAEYGYQNGDYTDTVLKSVTRHVAWLFTVTGLVGLAFTFAYPVPARLPSFAVMAVGVSLIVVHRALEEHEPKVSRTLQRLVGRSA